ncbi:MAG: hypothetical protein M1825_002802 [Sarcosagium campestre]|nr:MAG: hypothetical protein M1825_002802 [Sarcosagium campestre]
MQQLVRSMRTVARPKPTSARFHIHDASRIPKRACRRYATAKPIQANLPEIFDVVCVGGGPAGLSLLAALRASSETAALKVALVESQDLSRTRRWKLPPSEASNRVSSLTPASVAFLEEIGSWRHIDRHRIQPYTEMQVWDGITGSRISFDWPPDAHHETIAYMTENLNLTSSLLARLEELGGVQIIDSSSVEGIEFGPDTEQVDLSTWPVVHLSNGKRLAARLLVGADGANSPVRSFSGIQSRGWDYNRHGVVATVTLEGDAHPGSPTTAYQRFLPTGPAALLPLPQNLSTLVWTTIPEHAAHLKKLSPTDLVALLNAAFRLSPIDIAYMHTQSEGQLDELIWREQHTAYDADLIPRRIEHVHEGTLASFPLKMRHADCYIGERVALVGDAAHTIHPLAGQGLNQGQGDVQALVDTIKTAVQSGQDIGSSMALEPYQAARYAANNTLLGVVDKLHKLYSVESGPLVPLRSWGLQAVDALRPVKAFLMATASGGR